MLRNNVLGTTTFFYPLGNTPAVCLTQDLLPKQRANILLLGCGDARNILFTTHMGSDHRLDVTCCDIEPAILARNILLFTLLADDTSAKTSDRIWNIYYHLYLDDDSLELLDSQAVKLLTLSDTLEQWNAGQYGHTLRFCDKRTFAKVKALWAGYSTQHLAPQDKLKRRNRYQATIDKARAAKEQIMGQSFPLSGVRSAAPIGIQALYDLPNMYRSFWECGTVNQGEDCNQKPEHPNPAFASSPNQALTLHYGVEPLLGFHLATAYAPLTSKSPLSSEHQQTTPAKGLVQTAQQQFREWSKSFRESIANGSIFRFFTGDAIAFCHTLQQAHTTIQSSDAKLYCDSWTFQPLKLDTEDYESSEHIAPLKFDIIDTSNLVDHLGALNILVATAPLLAERLTSTLYTEVLVQHESSVQAMVDNILCGHFGTVSLLLGLASIELWTNATAVPDIEEGMFDFVLQMTEMKTDKGVTQLRTRLRWKKLSALSDPPVLAAVSTSQLSADFEIDPEGMSRLLHSIYRQMFSHEDVRTLMQCMEIQGLEKTSNPYYNRASFAALLKQVKSHVVVDWDKTLNLFLNYLENDVSLPGSLSVSGNYMQELNLYLHLSEIYTVQLLQDRAPEMFNITTAKHLSSWGHVPPVLCITLEVPRQRLKVIKDKSLRNLGTPSLCCTVQSSRAAPHQWANTFSAVQVAFGNISTVGRKSDADCHVDVNEDPDGWAGESPLVVSFFIPTWVLVQEPQTAVVACGLQCTPHACVAFAKELGLELRIFETVLGDDRKVHITKFMPHMSGYPRFVVSSNKLESSSSNTEVAFRNTISANIAADGSQITGLTCKIDFLSVTAKTKLSDKTSLVELSWDSPMITDIVVGKTVKCRVRFPLPVSYSRSKLRIARKSSYIEIVTPVHHPLDTDAPPSFMFPTSVMSEMAAKSSMLPVSWNMPYTALDILPILDTKKTSKMQWLITHASLMMSSRERRIREARMSGRATNPLQEDVRVDFKDGVFSLLMHATSLQGAQANVFGLYKAGAGGVHILLFVSAVKLDLANHTVILDTAVLPLSHKILGDGMAAKFLGGLQLSQKLCMINVTEKELGLWKQILPALAERCRTWEHKPRSCEYLLTGRIPPSKGLEDAHTPLCSCGNGQLPQKFMGDLRLPHLEYVLQKYATRIAISPIFTVPFVEDCFLRDTPRGVGGIGDLYTSLQNKEQRCNACGSDKKKASNGTSEALLTCTRCKTAKYCCKECQKADWKEHKAVCIPL